MFINTVPIRVRFDEKKIPMKRAEERNVRFDIDLSSLAYSMQTTEKILCQAAWGVLLGIATNTDDALFGNVVSGRNENLDGIEDMVGMFINTVPIRVRFDEKTTFRDLIKDVDLQNVDNTEYGFVPLSACGKPIATVVVSEVGTVEGFPQLVRITDQTEYDLEMEVSPNAPDCILRYNGRRYASEEIDRIIKYLDRIYRAMAESSHLPILQSVEIDEEDKAFFRRSTADARKERKEERRAPIGAKEESVATCMAIVLGMENVCANDDFFDLGGDSIKSIRLSALLRKKGFSATVRQIMSMRTPEKIASVMLEKLPDENVSAEKVGIGVTEEDYAYAKYKFGENNIESVSRVTPLQEGMLFHVLSSGKDSVYYTHIVTETKRLDVDVLRKAVRLLLERHGVLRSNFIWTETGGIQVVLKQKDIDFTVTEGDIDKIAESDLWRGFDVSKDCLYRLTYVRGEADKDYLIQNTHHIITDGWSDTILTEDLEYLYKRLSEGKDIERYDAPEFIDYVEYLYGKDKEESREYFKRLFDGFDGVVEYLSGKEKKTLGDIGEYRFEVRSVAEAASRLSVTSSTVFQAAWGIALAKVGLKEDAAFGNVFSGRNDPIEGIEKAVGMFINTVPVRVRFDNGETFADVAYSVSKQTEEHTEYGFLSLTEVGVPIATVTVFENFGLADTPEAGGTVTDQTEYDLELESQGTKCILRYNGDRYALGEIEELAGYIARIVQEMASAPSTPVSYFALFTVDKAKEYKNTLKNALKEGERKPKRQLVGESEKLVAACVSSLLGTSDVGPDDDFFFLGGDSIKAIRLSAKLRSEGYRLTVKDIVERRTVKGIADALSVSEEIADVCCGKIPLTPVIKNFFEREYPDRDGYVQDVLVRFEADEETAERVLKKIYQYHDILRAEFSDGELFVPEVKDSRPLDFRKLKTDDVVKTCEEVRKTIKLSGPMFVCAYINKDEERYLYLCAHHLLVDGISWRILLEDMSLYSRGEELPAKTTSYLSWARRCLGKVKISEKESKFWEETEREIKYFLPADGTAPYSEEVVFSEDQTTKLVRNAGRAYGVRPDVVMMTALARSLRKIFKEEKSVLTLESHGRQPLFEHVDLTRTVGWFTCYYPVVLCGEGETEACLIRNKEHIASIAEGGVKYQFYTGEKKVTPEILFNYMGNYNGEVLDATLCDLPDDQDNPEMEKLDVEGEIMNGKLILSFRYNGVPHEIGKEIKDVFYKEMSDLIRLCEERMDRRFTSSDFGCADMPEEDFAFLLRTSPVRIAPLTPTQEGMVLCSELDPDEYLEQSIVKMPFVIEKEKAEKCFDVLARKYAVFRTEYVRTPAGNWYQAVKEDVSVSLRKADDWQKVAKLRIEEGVSLDNGVPLRIDYCDDIMVVTSHHVMMDAWSEGIFIDEFVRLYNGEKIPESEEISFADHASGYFLDRSADDYAYWTQLLSGAEATFVPGHAPNDSRRIERKSIKLDFSEEVVSFARRKGITENVVLESATALLLRKLTGRKDVCFGKVVSGRDAETARAVGLFISTVPVRVRSGEDVLKSIYAQNLALDEHKDCPLDEIYVRAGISDPIGLLYVFDSMENDETIKPLYVRDSTNYGITLGIGKEEGGFVADISYNSGEYLPEEIDSVLSLYASCCKELMGFSPEKQVPLVGGKEEYPQTLVELWRNNAPFILIDGEKRYDGKIVRERAETLAGYIGKRQRNGIVGIRCERGVNMLVGIYAVVLSGNAYMPIGMDYPEERVRFMCENAGCEIVLDDEFLSNYSYDGERKVVDVTGDDLCYVIYTSGSTGKPKGARISHRAIANRLAWMERTYPLSGGSILQKTPYTFDVSVWGIFRPVLFGGTLVVMPPKKHTDPRAIADYVRKYEITQVHFVPSVYDVYLDHVETSGAQPIKDLFLSGEKLSVKTVRRHFGAFGESSRLHNLYGPTECAVDVTYYDCTGEERDIPIGRPIDNVAISIESENEEMPCYVEGEIVVSGVGVGSGYIGEQQGGFISGKYYTGDIGWKDQDGLIHFVRRKDRQTKLHGLRIEPGEIESTLVGIAGVRDAAVEIVGEGDGYLCAFVVTDKDEKEIRRAIEKILPPYMTPSRIVTVDKIPLTINGKRDLAELKKGLSDRDVVLPQTTTDLILDAVYEGTGRKIGPDTPFREAGISSLDRMRLSVKLAPFGFTFADVVRAESIRELFKERHYDFLMRFTEGNRNAVVCIPYAGATGRIYEKIKVPGYDVYASVGCTFDECDEEKVAEEIREILSRYEKTVLYAHCLGTMTALKIAAKVPFEKVVLGAHVPDLVSSFFGRPIDSWKNTSDEKIVSTLRKAGLTTEDETFVPFFRKDVKEAARIEAEKPTIDIPAVVLLAEEDVLTKPSKNAERRWKKFLKGKVTVRILPYKGHYFAEDVDFGKMIGYLLGEEE